MHFDISFSELEKAMASIAVMANSKSLQGDLKNVTIHAIKETSAIEFVATTGRSAEIYKLDTTIVDFVDGKEFIQLRVKEIMDILTAFKSLKRTKVSTIRFNLDAEVKEKSKDAKDVDLVVVDVTEVALDENIENAASYTNTSSYRLVKVTTNTKMLEKNYESLRVDTSTCVPFEKEDVLLYLNALVPLYSKEGAGKAVSFGTDHIFTALGSAFFLMVNKLGEPFTGFSLKAAELFMFKDFIALNSGLTVAKYYSEDSPIPNLILKNDNVTISIECSLVGDEKSVESHIVETETGVVVDKFYLIDILKRVSINSSSLTLQVDMKDDAGSIKFKSESTKNEITNLKSKGAGSFTFDMNPTLLAQMILAQATYFEDSIFMYISYEADSPNHLSITCQDRSKLWRSHYRCSAGIARATW